MRWLLDFVQAHKVLSSIGGVFLAGVVCALALHTATASHAQTTQNEQDIKGLLEYQRGELERQRRELEAEQRAKDIVAQMCRAGETTNRARCAWAGVTLPKEN